MKKDVNWMRPFVVGPHFIVCMGIGGLFGWFLDEKFETRPVLLLVFLCFGMAAGFKYLFQELKVINREEEEARLGDLDEPKAHENENK